MLGCCLVGATISPPLTTWQERSFEILYGFSDIEDRFRLYKTSMNRARKLLRLIRSGRSGMGAYAGAARRGVHLATVLLRPPSGHRSGRRQARDRMRLIEIQYMVRVISRVVFC